MKKKLINLWPVIVLLMLSVLIIWPLFQRGYFSHHDDLQVMRIYEMRQCFQDLQIPCRWVPDMGYGNGFPLFNYYGVLPYYIGGVLSFFTTFVNAAKALFFIPLVLGGISMYFLGKELFGKIPGFVVGVLYLFAPYRALDSYVRGAIAESFALALVPLVFFFFLKLIRKNSWQNFLGSSLSLGAFLLCHNIMTLFFMPIFILYIVFWVITERSKNLTQLLVSFFIGFGLSAFFILPAYFEKSLVQIDTLTRLGLDFRAHFVTVNQLFFDRSWDYGASYFGPNDTISFQIGIPHWILAVISAAVALFVILISFNKTFLSIIRQTLKIKPQPKITNMSFFITFMFLVFLLSAFMMHGRSSFIWEWLKIIQIAQFPWRLLSVTIFTAGILGGFLVYIAPKKLQLVTAFLIISLAVVLNWQYFHPKAFFYHIDDNQMLSGELWRIQQQAGILDYLPVTAEEPKGPRPDRPEVITGKAEVGEFSSRSNKFEFRAEVKETANLEIPVFDFPNWQVFVNNEFFKHSNDNRLGRIRVDLPPGDYTIRGEFKNTWVRTFSNLLSLVSLFSLFLILYWSRKKGFLNN